MNLQSITTWANQIDIMQVNEKQRLRASEYKKMILNKSAIVSEMTAKINGYMADIQEYVDQLDKLNIRQLPDPEPTKDVEPQKSPLLPKDDDDNKSVQKGPKDAKEISSILP